MSRVKSIVWEQNGMNSNKLIVKLGNSTYLKAEQLSNGDFWWSVFIGKETYDMFHSGKPFPKNIEETKQQCEDKYNQIKDATK